MNRRQFIALAGAAGVAPVVVEDRSTAYRWVRGVSFNIRPGDRFRELKTGAWYKVRAVRCPGVSDDRHVHAPIDVLLEECAEGNYRSAIRFNEFGYEVHMIPDAFEVFP